MTFLPYQPFDLGPFFKVTGDQTKVQNCNIKQGHKTTVMTFCNLFPVDIV